MYKRVSAFYLLWVNKTQKGNLTTTACCVTVAACYIKGLYKLREYTMNTKTWEITWMEDSVCFQNCPLSSWSGGKVFKKGSQALKKQTNKTKASSSLSYCLGLGQERLPKLYKLQNERHIYWIFQDDDMEMISKIGKHERKTHVKGLIEEWVAEWLPSAETAAWPPSIWLSGSWSLWLFVSEKNKQTKKTRVSSRLLLLCQSREIENKTITRRTAVGGDF